MSRYRYIAAILLIVCGLASIKSQESSFLHLKNLFTHMATYSANYTQEKVYLHLDNNGYFPQETIWFKAYVLKAASLLPTDLSKVLYVELVNPQGEVVQRKTLPIYNGRTYGQFTLTDLLSTGFYEVRAYTRSMLNWDANYIYSRVIPIFEVPKDTTQFGTLKFEDSQQDSKLIYKRHEPAPLLNGQSQKKGNVILTFYPEGGHIVQGVATRVAYKLTDKQGTPLTDEITIYTANGTPLVSTQPLHEGMGMVELPMTWTGGYAVIKEAKEKEQRYILPESQATGCTLQTLTDEAGNLILHLCSSPSFTPQMLGISITCRSAACHFDTLSLSPSCTTTKTIPRQKLHDGIQQVTLFTPEGKILAERLVWIAPSGEGPQFECHQNQDSYAPFSPVVLDFTLKDNDGKPLQGEFSLSVQDIGGMVADDGISLKTDMLLCSDLRGYIHQPEYYFERDDSTHRQALDLLLMVQGWRRYEWQEMAGIKPFELKQPVEDGQLIDGRIQKSANQSETQGGLNVNLMLMQGNSFLQGTTQTDTQGRFAMQLDKEFYDDAIGYFTITDNHDKRQRMVMLLNRNFYPHPKTYEPQQLHLEQPAQLRKNIVANHLPNLFQWTDTLPKIHHLSAVKVKDHFVAPDFGSRYTYLGGEEGGKRHADIYYNVEDELQRYMDTGRGEPLLWDWLKERNPYFRYDVEDGPEGSSYYKLEYKLHDVILLLDNKTPLDPQNFFMAGDIKSLIICEDASSVKNFLPDADITGARPPILFLLYSNLGTKLLSTEKKGTRGTIIHGYSRAMEFYSPNYRMEAAPSASDARRTLYWNPTVTTDKEGKANVLLFSNFRQNMKIHINAQGISQQGTLFSNKNIFSPQQP